MFKDMRRKDRQLSTDEAMEILQNGKYGVMSVVGEDGYPYGVPLHYVMMDGKLHFHCSVKGGHKTDCIKHNPKISFTVIEPQEGVRCKSAILFGIATPVPEKRAMVLEKIVEKFVPEFAWGKAKGGIPYAKNKIEAYELAIDHLTAKVIDKPEGMSEHIILDPPLVEGIIQKRKSQFTILVKVDGEIYSCHSPTTGRIGNIEIGGRPCLLSKSNDPNRKTPFTVEAVSLNHPEESEKSWIGINQNAANRYVEHYLKNGGFTDMVGANDNVRREVFLGKSKLDFLVGDTYLEVKTPLQQLQISIPDYVKTKKSSPFSSTDRFVRHITELTDSLQDHHRAILLTCFIYNNPGFEVIERSTNYETVKVAVGNATAKGVEIWQANFKIAKDKVILERYFKLSM